VTRWEYVLVSRGSEDKTWITFSADQGSGLVARWRQLYPRELKEKESTSRAIVLSRKGVSPVHLLGVLGDQGWEAIVLSTTDNVGFGSLDCLLKRAVGDTTPGRQAAGA
jgi:hypothetical protein